jgi:hypothetical protein
MDRRAAVTVALLALPAATLAAKRAAPRRAAPSLRVIAVDREARKLDIQLTGVKRAPEPNLFTFTDERGRRFVAMSVRCEPPAPESPSRHCAIEMPSGYERHALVGLELHLHGLHSRAVAAPPDEVAAAWAAAVEHVGSRAPAPLDGGGGGGGAPLDGGSPP